MTPLDRQFKRYLNGILLGLAFVLSLVGAFNWLVDPYGIWGVVRIEGLNWQKSERRDQNYMFKAVDLIEKRPQTLIIGSSRAAFGLNPEHPAFARAQLGPVYNAALTGGHLYALRTYLDHAIYNNPDLEAIVWGVDFFAFSSTVELASSYREDRLGRHSLPLSDVSETLWSLDALGASWRTIVSNRRRPDYTPYYDNGQLSAMDMASQVNENGMIERFDQSLWMYLNSRGRFLDYQDSPAAWHEFEGILEIARLNDIAVYLFVPPVHMAMFAAIQQRGLWPAYKQWLSRMALLHPLTDFSGPGPITGEPIAFEMNYYWDVSHFRSVVGDHILEHLLDTQMSSDMLPGAPVGKDNIDQYLRDLEKRIRDWLEQHSDVGRLVGERVSAG